MMRSSPHAVAARGPDPTAASPRAIGELIRDACELTDDQVEQILAYQRRRGLRFGEAAVALRFAERKDVLDALAEQFQYTSGFAGRESSSELVSAADPFGDQADAFRELRSRLLLEALGGQARCALAVVSPDHGDGKTYIAANLAVSFSQLGERTLLIDADLRVPRAHTLLGVDAAPGLSSLLAGFPIDRDPVQPVLGLPSLFVMPAGPVPPNPLELLQRARLRSVLREMVRQFDHVVVDTPAAVRGADPRVVAAQCEATLVVGRAGGSRLDALESLLASLGRGPTRIVGIVMNEH
jgi:chain length determinant protein tyrosine kinase EpsG